MTTLTFEGRMMIAATAVLVSACGAGWNSSSERSILPEFRASQLRHKHVFFAPYARASVVADEGVPLSTELMNAIARDYGHREPIVGALQDFYAGLTRDAARSLKEHSGATSVQVAPDQWKEYFDDPAAFVSISIDGDHRFQVPQRELLRRMGKDAEFAVVIDSLAFSHLVTQDRIQTQNNVTYTTRRELGCKGNFLVWDYEHARVIAVGEVKSSVGIGKEIEREDWLEAAQYMGVEIVRKRPFAEP